MRINKHLTMTAMNSQTAQRDGKAMLDRKAGSKTALQEGLGWPSESKRPLLCLPAGLSKATGGELFEHVLPGLLTLPIEMLVVGKGSSDYGTMVTKLAKEHGHRIAIMQNDEAHLDAMYQASDMALFLAPPSSKDLTACLHAGVVPIAPSMDELDNYNPVQESGNAFLYDKIDPWHCFAAVVRALETHIFPFDWRTIQKHCIGVM